VSGDEVYQVGSQVEAVVAVEHHRHHPADPNVGVVRGRLSRQAVIAAAVTAAVTLVGIVLLAIAIGNGS
jgi:hypothetical protein